MSSGSVSIAAARSASRSGARATSSASVRGRIAALVSAWGLPQTRTRVWQTTWWRPNMPESIA